jgi:hypothetical protein
MEWNVTWFHLLSCSLDYQLPFARLDDRLYRDGCEHVWCSNNPESLMTRLRTWQRRHSDKIFIGSGKSSTIHSFVYMWGRAEYRHFAILEPDQYNFTARSHKRT